MSIKRIIIFIIFFILFIFAKLGNYISIKLLEIDDCIMNFKINNDIYEIIPMSIIPDKIDKCYKNKDYYGNQFKDIFILRNHEINFNEKVEFSFGDSDHTEGWMKIDIFYNEYRIQTRDRVFWTCRDCNHTGHSNYVIEKEEGRGYSFWSNGRFLQGQVIEVDKRLYFYYMPGNGTRNHLYIYHFDFIINDITDLYKGGYDGRPFKINHNFYSLGPENKTFEFTICSTK